MSKQNKQRTIIEDLIIESKELLELSDEEQQMLVGGITYSNLKKGKENSSTENNDYDYS